VKRIVIHEENCIGCRLCEVHCLVQHSESKDIVRAYKVERPRSDRYMPRIMVEESGPISFALQCRQCEEPSCLEACISGAMHREAATGAVICDESRCVGCWMCIMVCPAGAIQQGRLGHQIASKCDLCYGAELPACVAHCPNEALTYEDTPLGGEPG